jgi:hypothetical protein
MLVPVIKILWNRYMRTAMTHIRTRAEKEVVEHELMGMAR